MLKKKEYIKKIFIITIMFLLLSFNFLSFFSKAVTLHEMDDGLTDGFTTLNLIENLSVNSYDVYTLNNYIYVACGTDGLKIYRTDGISLTLVDTQDDGGTYIGVYCDGTYVYTACYSDGIYAYSFDGTTISLIDSQDDSGYYQNIYSDGTYIYVQCYSILHAYSFNGVSFSLLDTQNDGLSYTDIDGDGSYIYTSCGSDGVYAYSFNGVSFTYIDSSDDGVYSEFGALGVGCDTSYIYVGYATDGVCAYSFSGTSFTLLDRFDDDKFYTDISVNTTTGYIVACCYIDSIKIFYFEGTDLEMIDSHIANSECVDFDKYIVTSSQNGEKEGDIFVFNYEQFTVTRDVDTNTESMNFTFSVSKKQINTSLIKLKIPVSIGVSGIVDVTNNTDDINASEVASISSLSNNTYYFDSTNFFVYIGTTNLIEGTTVNWTINCTYDAYFNIDIPDYLEVGEYLIMQGLILNSTDDPLPGLIARTYIYYTNGSIAKGSNPAIRWNCYNGNYEATISTTSLPPGIYYVQIEFTDPNTGVTYRYGETLYISLDTPTGVYSNAVVHFNIYNTNQGLGLPSETLKIYVDGTRIYSTDYYTYTGKTINVTVKDYYDTSLFQNNYTITSTDRGIDVGLTFHSWLFGNKNDDYYFISMLKQNGTRWWEKGIVPYSEKEFLVPSGYYIMRVYDGSYNEIYNTSSYTLVNASQVYVIHGTNLSLIMSGLSVIKGQLLESRTETSGDTTQTGVYVPPSIPPVEPPTYLTGYSVDECYSIINSDKLSKTYADATIVFMDSGVRPQNYNDVDLTKIHLYYHSAYEDGFDYYGHGTFIGFEIASLLQKKAPNAKIISYKAFGIDGRTTQKTFEESIDNIKKLNPDVVSISAGATGTKDDIYSRKIKELHDMGIIVIVSAGNEGPELYSILSPACSESAIAVGASDPQQTITGLTDDTICIWSSRGPVPNIQEPKPDLVAPGESITGPWGYTENTVSGTSLSTPLIASSTTTIVAEHKNLINLVKTLWFWNKGVIPDAYEDALQESCVKKGDKYTWGAGIVQMDKVSQIFFIKLIILILIPIILVISFVTLLFLTYKYRDKIRDKIKK